MTFDSRAKLAFVVACLVLLLASAGMRLAVGALNIYLQKEPVALRGSFTTLPRVLGPWRAIGEDGVLDEAMIQELRTRQYLNRTYALNGRPADGVLALHLAYYTGMIDAVPHVPDRCLLAAGYHQKTLPANYELPITQAGWKTDANLLNLRTGQPYQFVTIHDDFTGRQEVRMPVGRIRLRAIQFEHETNPQVPVFGGYLFIANGRTAPAPEDVRAMAFDRSEKYAYYCKVQFMYSERDATLSRYQSLVTDFMGELLPHLMQRLPDWSVVEREDERAPAHAARGTQSEKF